MIASLNRIRDPKTGSPYAARLSMVKDIVDDKGEVVINLNTPSVPLLGQLEALAIVPGRGRSPRPPTCRRAPVGTGPFKFDKWVTDADRAWPKNPDYHIAGLPKLAG